MTRPPRFLLPILFTLGCAHQPAKPLPTELAAASLAPDPAALQAVRELLASQDAAWNRGDLVGNIAGPHFTPEINHRSMPWWCPGGISIQHWTGESRQQSFDRADRAIMQTQEDAWNRGDLVGYMAGYWRSPQLTFFAGGAVTTGWDETLARYQRRYQGEGKAMGTLTFENLQLEQLGPQAALARGRWVLNFAPPAPPATGAASPAPSRPAAGLFTVLLRRKPEGWRIVHDHSCSD